MARLLYRAVAKQELSSDHYGKRPEEPCLLYAILVYAPCDHQLGCLINLVLAHYNLHVLVHYKSNLGESITGSSMHPRVRLPAVTF